MKELELKLRKEYNNNNKSISAEKAKIYRSLRRILAELRKNGCELDYYLKHTVINKNDTLYKYLTVLNPYLNLQYTETTGFEITNPYARKIGDLLEFIVQSGFNMDGVSKLVYFIENKTDHDRVVTLVYTDSVEPKRSRVDRFILNDMGIRR